MDLKRSGKGKLTGEEAGLSLVQGNLTVGCVRI